MAWRWSSGGARAALFWAPVVGVAAVSQTGIGLESPWTGSGGALALTGVLLALPLALRAGRPLAATLLLAVVLNLQVALGGSLHFGSFVAVLVTAYALGRYGSVREIAAGWPLLLVAIAWSVRSSLPADTAELVFPLFYVSAALAVGVVVHRLSDQAAELRRLNTALEQDRDLSTQLAVATERMRLARDLHDSVAHTLTVTVIQAEDCEGAISSDPARARAAAQEIQQAARLGLDELRGTVRFLRDGDRRASEPGLAEVDALARVMAGAGLEVVVRRTGDADAVPPQLAQELFRIVQEAVTNVVKHSAASSTTVSIDVSPDVARVVVTDPGPALARGLPSGDQGLAGMAERLTAYGGSVVTGTEAAGFVVRASVPLGVPA